jgi:hypothetical protein
VIAPQANSLLAQEMDSTSEKMNSATKTITRDGMFKYISADIADAADGIIIVMTDAQLGLTMPGTKSLAKKFGAPSKSTGYRYPPQHAPALQVRANGGNQSEKGSPNSFSANLTTPRDAPRNAIIDPATPKIAPTQEDIVALRQEMDKLRKSVATIGVIRNELSNPSKDLFYLESNDNNDVEIVREVGKLDKKSMAAIQELMDSSPKAKPRLYPYPTFSLFYGR